jgi:hypothetical protein
VGTLHVFSADVAQSQLKAKTAQQLAALAGLPHLREYLVSRHIVLHAEVEVVLLALIHQRQLTWLRGKTKRLLLNAEFFCMRDCKP